jgi:uncharacterized protein YbaR (Trm112 family)
VLDFQRANNGRLNVPISEILLEKLVCPLCKVKVELNADSSGLKCPECHRLYPVRDGLPVMLPDDATVEGAA